MTANPGKAIFEQEVLPLFEEHRGDFLARARDVARRICRERGSATIDDVRAICPPPASINPNVMGAVFKTPEFECAGHAKSARKECHGRHLRLFRLVA